MSTTDDTRPAGDATPPRTGPNDPATPPAPPADPAGQQGEQPEQPEQPDDDAHVQRKIVDPNDVGFHFAMVMQWVLLHPEINHTACRVYGVMRSLYTHRRDLRTISKDQLRWLVPGVNGKPMSVTALNDALVVLEHFELVVNPDGKSKTWRLRDPQTGELKAQTEMTFQLGLLPPEGDAFTGFRNVFDKRDAYPGPGWDGKTKKRTRKVVHNGQVAPSTGIPVEADEPGGPPAVDNPERAGEPLDRNSGPGSNGSATLDRNSEHLDRNSGRHKPLTSGNEAPKNYLQELPEQEHAAAGPPLRSGPLPTEQSGQVAQVVTNQGELILNRHHARARQLAGAAACEAIQNKPDITEHELMVIVAETYPNLDSHQIQMRAIQLHAFEKTARQRQAASAAGPGTARTPGRHRAGRRRPATMMPRAAGTG